MSLKDALAKAGLKSTKTQNERKTVPKKELKKSEKHQKTRNFCEVCELIQPDVERFKHNNPTIDAEWICAACADREMIHDKFRMTHQSTFADQRRYRREFGPTRDVSEFKGPSGFKSSPSSNKGPKKEFKKRPSHSNKKTNQNKSASFVIDEDGEKNFNC